MHTDIVTSARAHRPLFVHSLSRALSCALIQARVCDLLPTLILPFTFILSFLSLLAPSLSLLIVLFSLSVHTGPGRSMVSGRLAAAWRPSGLAAAAAVASCMLLAVAMTSLNGRPSPMELLETQAMGMGYIPTPAQDFAAPPSQQQQYVYAQQQPQYYTQGQLLAAVPCSQSLAGCPPSPAEAELANPAAAPNYNSGAGMTYMPSTQSGVSAADQSPDLPRAFLDDEAKSHKRMKKLAKLLKKSSKEQDALDVQTKDLSSYVQGEVTAIRNDVLELNAKESDEISAPYHLVDGAR